MNRLLTQLVMLSLNRAKTVLLTCVVLSIAGITLFSIEGRLNSNLSHLIQPKGNQDWHLSNQAHVKAFPAYQQTAIVVVRGSNASDTKNATRLLSTSLEQSQAFDQVFAPSVAPFIEAHRLYFLDPPDLSNWLQGTEFNFGVLQRLNEQPSLSNALLIVADLLGVQSGQPLPITMTSLIDGLLDGRASVDGFYPLAPPEAAQFFELIIVIWPTKP